MSQAVSRDPPLRREDSTENGGEDDHETLNWSVSAISSDLEGKGKVGRQRGMMRNYHPSEEEEEVSSSGGVSPAETRQQGEYMIQIRCQSVKYVRTRFVCSED